MRRVVRGLVVIGAVVLGVAMGPARLWGPAHLCGEETDLRLTEARFRELSEALRPAEEPWRTIPWRIALLDAQRAAAEQHKPIFIWAMDGHPLGCT